MVMFGSSKPVVFQPSGYSRRRRLRVPRWLVLLLIGSALGAGGLLFMQESYGPERLTVEQSQKLSNDLFSATQERQRLQDALDRANSELESERNALRRQATQLEQALTAVEPLKQDIALFEAIMPPDPRSGNVAVRGARFDREQGKSTYHVLLTRAAGADGQPPAPFQGQYQFTVAGVYPSGRGNTLTLDPAALQMEQYRHLQGTLELPEGFSPRQITLRILDGNNRVQGMRVFNAR